jgi:hypothetical protein
MNIIKKYLILFMSVALLTSIVAAAAPSGTAQAQQVAAQLCGIIQTVEIVVGVLTLLLFIIGGTIYAFAHFLPGQTRGAAQGWALGMVIGGVVGLVIVLIAPFVVQQVAGGSTYISQSLTTCTSMI